MIRINLLKPLQVPARPLVFDEPAKPRAAKVAAIAGLCLAAAGIGAVLLFPGAFGNLFGPGEQPKVVEAPPEPRPASSGPAPAKVAPGAVEETVRDLNPQASRPAGPATYADLVPSQKIEYQYYAATRLLKEIKSITPPEVGFANFIFSPPGEFYVHGLAAGQEDLDRFRRGLAGLAGAEIKPGMNVPAGVRGRAKEFSFFGSVRYPVESMSAPPDRVLPKAELTKELNRMKKVAGSLGIRMKEPRLLNSAQAGNVKKMVWEATADCNFQQMQDFLTELHESKANLGVLKFALRARGDEKVVADMDILAYVEP